MTRLDAILLALFWGPGLATYALAFVWIHVLQQPLFPLVAPDYVPLELAKQVSLYWFMAIGVALVTVGVWEEVRT